MSPPDAIPIAIVEDEFRAFRPAVNIPVIDNDESEDESSENGGIEAEMPPEGEPLGEGPEEAPLVGETDDDTGDHEEASDFSVTPPTSPNTSPISPRVDHTSPLPGSPVVRAEPSSNFYVGESSHGIVRPRQDDLYMNFVPRQRIYSPERVPPYTTPARYSLTGDPNYLPAPPTVPPYNPDLTLQIYRQLQTIQDQQRSILNRQDYLERMAAYDSSRVNYRLDGFEIELMRLRSTVTEMSARLDRLEGTNLRRRD